MNEKNIKEKKICGYCKAEVAFDTDYCPKCGNSYIPLICDNCQKEISAPTKFCPSCGCRVKSLKEKKKSKIIKSSAIIASIVLVISFCLVLFVPYDSYHWCTSCAGDGERECRVKIIMEKIEGRKMPNHDCEDCFSGYEECVYCDGKGGWTERTTNFEKWFS